MKSAIDLLVAHRDICVNKAIQADKRGWKKRAEAWRTKANDVIEALFVLYSERPAPKAK